jgi:hypothetical protein
MNSNSLDDVPTQTENVNISNEAIALVDGGNGEIVAVTDSAPTTTSPVQSQTGFLSFLWSPIASLFGMNAKPAQPIPVQTETITIEEEKPERRKKTYTEWLGQMIQNFGADAGKTMSDTLKDPLTQLAKSPVLRTGEVLVVHSVDFESLRLKKTLYYLFVFILFGRLSKHMLDLIFNRRRKAVTNGRYKAITDS